MDDTTRRDPLSKPERRLIWATALFVLLVGGTCGWWYWINLPPKASIPPQVLPVPNGFDTMQAAYALAVTNIDVSTPKHQRVIGYQHIHCAIDGDQMRMNVPKWPKDAPVPTISEFENLVSKNKAAYALLRTAFAQDVVIPRSVARTRSSYQWEIADLLDIPFTAGTIKAVNGDRIGAVNDYTESMKYSAIIARSGGLFGLSIGVVAQRDYRIELWKAIDKLPFKATLSTVERLDEVMSLSIPYADVLTEEKYILQGHLLQELNTPYWRDIDLTTPVSRWNLLSKSKVYSELTKYMDAYLLDVNKSYLDYSGTIPSEPDCLTFFRALRQHRFLPGPNSLRFVYYNNRLQNNLLMTAFALHAYKLEHGEYPETLNELIPEFLSTVPVDPCSKNAPLRYHRQGRTYLLYSIGPDGKDDGGIPSSDGHMFRFTEALKGRRDLRHDPLTASSTGDIVAGINVY